MAHVPLPLMAVIMCPLRAVLLHQQHVRAASSQAAGHAEVPCSPEPHKRCIFGGALGDPLHCLSGLAVREDMLPMLFSLLSMAVCLPCRHCPSFWTGWQTPSLPSSSV